MADRALDKGRPIGSTLIDMKFHNLISERLSRISSHLNGDPRIIADNMMQGRFERMKCSFGTPAAATIPAIPLPVPGLDPGYSFPNVHIEDSAMKITRFVADPHII